MKIKAIDGVWPMAVVQELNEWLVAAQPKIRDIRLLMSSTSSNMQHMVVVVLYEPTERVADVAPVSWNVNLYECRDSQELMRFLENEEVEMVGRQVLNSWAPCANLIIGTGKYSIMLLSVREWLPQVEADLGHPKANISSKRGK